MVCPIPQRPDLTEAHSPSRVGKGLGLGRLLVNDQFVDAQAMDFQFADHEAADFPILDGECADCQRANRHRTDGHRAHCRRADGDRADPRPSYRRAG